MTKHLWMPLDIDAYLGDTDHLTVVEHGAYLLLIMRYWKDRCLPTDERMIARHAHLTPEQWEESRDVLAAFFDENWRHKRIDAELSRADEIVSKRKAAAEQRYSKSNAHAEQVDSKSTYTRVPPSPKPSSSLRSEDQQARQRATRLSEDWVLPEAWVSDALDAGLSADRVQVEANKMRDWSRSSPKGACADWRARWRNWCRTAAESLPRAGPPTKRNPALEAANRLMEQLDAVTSSETPPDPAYPRLVAIPGHR